MAEQDDQSAPWDEEVAQNLIGALVLVGMTRLAHDDTFLRQEQIYGRVVVANQRDGVCLRLEGSRDGERYWLPPTTAPYQRAAPGQYELRSTGEVVSNPDYLSTWVLSEPLEDPPSEGQAAKQ